MERRNILRKISKLLALAGNNPNENEAATALLQARKIMQKFDIEEREVEGHSENPNTKVKEGVGYKKNYYKWELYLAGGLTNLLPVEMIIKVNNYGKRPVFIGHTSDVDVVLEMYDYIRKVIGKLGRKQPNSRTNRSFCLGATATVCERIRKMKEEEERKSYEDKNGVEATYALICVDKEKEIINYIKDEYPTLETQKQRSTTIDPRAYQDGRRAGRNINLNKQLQGA